MTEAEWFACTVPQKMLKFLREKGSERKLRLFACACCRRSTTLTDDLRCRYPLETAERWADRLCTEEELRTATNEVATTFDQYLDQRHPNKCFAQAAYASVFTEEHLAATVVSKVMFAVSSNQEIERQIQCSLIRDIFGNPFRPVSLNSAWLTWNDSTNPNLAQAIYDERAYDRLPILADGLEEEGCDNEDFLYHCRQPGEHVRGCWIVDLLLGKE